MKKPPRSEIYDDIYFSTEDGMAESNAVFLEGINAPDVWKNQKHFTICELGFGTGLNFLNTINMWLKTTSNDQKLHYIATEKHPLNRAEILNAVHWHEHTNNLEEMLRDYPEPNLLFDDRVKLTLLLGDSREQLSQLSYKVDAWYMDGFAPAKNPDMWSPELMSLMARHSNDGAKLATFSAAGAVRRGLIEVGFEVDKKKGFGKKREMMTGIFKGF